jgi:hypothetical protein
VLAYEPSFLVCCNSLRPDPLSPIDPNQNCGSVRCTNYASVVKVRVREGDTKPAVKAGGTWYLALSRLGYRTACPSTLASLVRVRLCSRPAHEALVVYSLCAALSRAFIGDLFDPRRPNRPAERRGETKPASSAGGTITSR